MMPRGDVTPLLHQNPGIVLADPTTPRLREGKGGGGGGGGGGHKPGRESTNQCVTGTQNGCQLIITRFLPVHLLTAIKPPSSTSSNSLSHLSL